MKLNPDRMAAAGPMRTLNVRFADSCAATGHPGRARRLGEAVFASLRLPCAARSRGPVAQLPPFAALTVVEQARRVRSRSALRARAPSPVLLDASHARRALPGCPVAETVVACVASNTDPVAGKAAGGAWAGRIGAAEEVSPDTNSPVDCLCLASGRGASPGAACKARVRGPRAQRASCSDSLRVFDHSERSERRELRNGAPGSFDKLRMRGRPSIPQDSSTGQSERCEDRFTCALGPARVPRCRAARRKAEIRRPKRAESRCPSSASRVARSAVEQLK